MISQGSSIRHTLAIAIATASLAMVTPSLASPTAPAEHGSMMMKHGADDGHGKSKGHSSGYDKGYSDGGHHMVPHNAASHFLHMAKALSLSDDQVKKLKTLRDDYIAKFSKPEAELDAAKSDLKMMLHQDFDRKAVDGVLSNIGKTEGVLWSGFVDQLQAINDTLTADQKKALKGMHHGGHPMGGMGMDKSMGMDKKEMPGKDMMMDKGAKPKGM